MNLGKLDVAMEKLKHALDVDDDNVNAHNFLAVLYAKMHKNN